MRENKVLLKNTVLYSIGSFGTKILIYFLVPIYTYYMTTADYGIADMSVLLLQIVSILLTGKIASALVRFSLGNKEKGPDYFTNSLFVVFVTFLFVLGLCFILSLTSFSRPELLPIFPVLYILFNLYECLTEYVKAIDHSLVYVIAGLLYSICLFITNILLLNKVGGTVQVYLLSQIVSYSVAILFVIVAVKIRTIPIIGKVDFVLIKDMLRYSIYLAPAALLLWIIQSSDRYMVAWLIGTSDAGIYGAAYKIPSICAALVAVFGSAWHISASHEENNEKYHSEMFHFYIMISVLASGTIILLANVFSMSLFKADFIEAKKYVPLLIFAHLFSYLQTFLEMILIARKMSKDIFTSVIVGSITNIILNLFLIKRIGIWGAIVATLVCYLYIFLNRYCILRQRNWIGKIKWNEYLSFALVATQALIYSCNISYVWLISVFLWVICIGLYNKEINRVILFVFRVMREKRK